MYKTKILLILFMMISITGLCQAAEEPNEKSEVMNFWKCTSPTNGFWGLNDKLAPLGIEIGLGITNIYQANVHGGLSTDNHNGRYTGSYDIEIAADLQKLMGLKAGSLFMHIEGSWPDAEGIDPTSVGSFFGINADAIGNENIVVKQLFYEGPVFRDNIILTIGKIDFTGVFDKSAYADDECCQFLNAALVDNPTIPFPAYSLGLALTWNLTDSWYLLGGLADAQADSRETGFRTAFHKQDYFFYGLETGITPQINSANGSMQGAYRLGIWYDSQPKASTDLTEAGKNYRDDTGVYTSCDQMLYKENNSSDDTQGLGVFFRYGFAHSRTNDLNNFLSAGLQYQGLFENRNDDVLGVGYARGFFSNNSSTTYTEDYESVFEVYYNAQITPWMFVSPNIQYVSNPGGSGAARDALVVGLRAQIAF